MRSQLLVHDAFFSSDEPDVFLLCQCSDVINWLGFRDTRGYQNLKSTITKDTKHSDFRVRGACAVKAARAGELVEQFDKYWLFPCFILL